MLAAIFRATGFRLGKSKQVRQIDLGPLTSSNTCSIVPWFWQIKVNYQHHTFQRILKKYAREKISDYAVIVLQYEYLALENYRKFVDKSCFLK